MCRFSDLFGKLRLLPIFTTIACFLTSPLFAQTSPECDSIQVEAFSLRDNDAGLIVLATDRPGRDTLVDSLAITVPQGKAGLYEIFSLIGYNSGNEQLNETFYMIVVHPDGRRSYPIFANIPKEEVGKVDANGDSISYNVILDDGLEDNHTNERQAGIFYFEEGRNIVELHHYNDIALEFPQFVNCPDSATTGRNCIMGDPDIIQGPQSVRVSIFTIVELCADLELTQSAFTGATAIVNGDTALAEFEERQFEYLLTVKNNGPATAQDFTLTDTIPSLLTPDFGLRPPDAEVDDGQNRIVTWNYTGADSLPVGAEDSIRFNVTVPIVAEPLPFPLFSAARTEIARDPVPENDYDSTTVFVVDSSLAFFPNFDLGIDYTADQDTVFSGESYSYTLTVTNFGPGDAGAFTVTDTLPAQVTLIDPPPDFGGQATVTFINNILVWQFNSLPRDSAVSVSFGVTAAEVQTPTNLPSTAVIEAQGDLSPGNNQASVDVVAIPKAAQVKFDLAHTHTAGRDSVLSGEKYFYTLEIDNNGPAAAYDFTLRDILPNVITVAGALPDFGGKAQVSQNNNVITWQIDSLLAGQSLVGSFEVLAGGVLDTVSLLNSSFIQAENDTTPNNNFAQTTIVVSPLPTALLNYDLAHTQTVSRDSVMSGETFFYTLTIENNGLANAFDFMLRDTLPAEVNVSGALPDFGGKAQASQNGGVVSWQIDSLAAGQTLVDSFQVQVVGQFADFTDLINSSIVEAVNDTTLGNNFDLTTVVVLPNVPASANYDLAHSQTASRDSVMSGEAYFYTLQIDNNGLSTAFDFALRDTLPAEVNVSGALPDFGGKAQASQNGGVVSWQIDSLTAGQTLVDSFQVQVVGQFADFTDLINSSIVEAANDTTPGNNFDQTTVVVLPDVPASANYDLAHTQTASRDSIMSGEAYFYTLQIDNNGPLTAFDFALRDTLPAQVNVSGALPDFGGKAQPSQNGGVVSWQIDSLAAGQTLVDSFQVQVVGQFADFTNLINSSIVEAANDTTPDNNFDQTTVVVLPDVPASANYDLAHFQTASSDSVLSGESFFYTLTIENNGPTTAFDFALSDTLPNEVAVAGSLPDFNSKAQASQNGAVISWQIDSLAAGQTLIDSFQVQVVGQFADFTDLMNSSIVEAPNDTTPDNNFDQTTVVVLPDAPASANYDLAHFQSASKDSVISGETFLYTLTIENNGLATALDFTMRDTLPENVTPVGAPPDFGGKAQVTAMNNILHWQFDSLAAGQTLTDSFLAHAVGEFQNFTDLINSSIVEAANDTTPDNNFAQTTVVVTPDASTSANYDLAHSQTASRDSVLSGETIFYTLQIDNNGLMTAFDFTLRDTLPDEVSVSGALPDFNGQAQVSQFGSVISWRFDSLRVGKSAADVLEVRVGEILVEKDLINFSRVEAANDTTPDNNAAQTSVRALLKDVGNPRNFTLTHAQLADVDTVRSGESFSYTLIVENLGPDSSLAFTMTDTLPDLVETSGTIPLLDSRDGKTLRWRFEPLAPDEMLSLTFPVVAGDFPDDSVTPLLNKSAVSDGDTTLFAETLVWGVRQITPTGLPIDCFLDRNIFIPEAEQVLGINFDLDSPTRVRIDVHDMAGVHIVQLADEIFQPGRNRYEWNGVDKHGIPAGSGLYIITFRADTFSDWKKVMVVR